MLESVGEMDSTDVFHELTTKENKTFSLQILSLLHHVHDTMISRAKKDQGVLEDDEDPDESGMTESKDQQAAKDDKEDGDDGDKKLNYDGLKRELIYPFLMNLLFDQTLIEIEKITYDQIKFHYWDYDEPEINSWEVKPEGAAATAAYPDPDNPADPQSQKIDETPDELRRMIFEMFNAAQYFQTIQNLMVRYFKLQYADLIEEEKENYADFIRLGYDPEKVNDTRNLRNEVANMLYIENKYKPLDFDFLLVRQLFVTSLFPADPVLSIRMSDIIKIYNTLVD